MQHTHARMHAHTHTHAHTYTQTHTHECAHVQTFDRNHSTTSAAERQPIGPLCPRVAIPCDSTYIHPSYDDAVTRHSRHYAFLVMILKRAGLLIEY